MTVPWKSWALPGWPSSGLGHRAVPLGVEHEGRLAVVRELHRRGEVAGVAEPADLAGGHVDLGQGVVAAVGDVERAAAQRQGVGHAAEHPQRSPSQQEGPRDGAGRQVDLADRVAHGVGDVGAAALHDDRRRVDADLDVPGGAGREIDEADRARGRRPALVDHDVEVLALGRPVAGPGRPAAPVADDQRAFVLGEPRLVGERLHRVFAHESVRGQVDLGDGVMVGRGDEQPTAVARDGHPAGDRIAPGPPRLDGDPGPGLQLAALVGEDPDERPVGAGEEPRAIGRPGQPAESGRGRIAERDLRPLSDAAGVGEEDLVLAQHGEDRVAGMHGQVDRPALEGDRAPLDPLTRRHQEVAVGLVAHPDRRRGRAAPDPGREHQQAEQAQQEDQTERSRPPDTHDRRSPRGIRDVLTLRSGSLVPRTDLIRNEFIEIITAAPGTHDSRAVFRPSPVGFTRPRGRHRHRRARACPGRSPGRPGYSREPLKRLYQLIRFSQ